MENIDQMVRNEPIVTSTVRMWRQLKHYFRILDDVNTVVMESSKQSWWTSFFTFITSVCLQFFANGFIQAVNFLPHSELYDALSFSLKTDSEAYNAFMNMKCGCDCVYV